MTTKEFNRFLRLIANGNQRAMKAFYDYYYEKIRASAQGEGISKANSHDVASKVLGDIFERAANYIPIKYPKAWMYKVVQNAIINYKKQNAKYVYTELIDDMYAAKDENLDLKIEFNQFLAKLPPRQREIAELHYLYGFKIREIAKQIKISVSTVNRDIALLKVEMKNFKKFFE